MNLEIQTITRGEGVGTEYAAVVSEPHSVLTACSEWSATPAQAVAAATDAYFTATEPKIGPVIVSGPYEPSPELQKMRVASTLTDALNASPVPELSMIYEDAEGNITQRRIIPSRIEDGRGRFGFTEKRHLIALDVEKDEPRTFRIDRIQQVWPA